MNIPLLRCDFRLGHAHPKTVIFNGILNKKKKIENEPKSWKICDFAEYPLGRGFRRSWGKLRTGVEGFVTAACSTAKKNVIFFRTAVAAIPEGGARNWQLAAERPTSVSAANCGREAATRTSATIRNVLSTVYAPSGAERLAKWSVRGASRPARSRGWAARSAPLGA